jgi:hypothetical protein
MKCYVHALVVLIHLLSDEQYQLVRRNGYTTRRVWDAIGEAFDESYERQERFG